MWNCMLYTNSESLSDMFSVINVYWCIMYLCTPCTFVYTLYTWCFNIKVIVLSHLSALWMLKNISFVSSHKTSCSVPCCHALLTVSCKLFNVFTVSQYVVSKLPHPLTHQCRWVKLHNIINVAVAQPGFSFGFTQAHAPPLSSLPLFSPFTVPAFPSSLSCQSLPALPLT